MGLDDFLKNNKDDLELLEYKKAYYEEIKKSSKMLNKVRLELYGRIKTQEFCKKTAELYCNLSNNWRKWLGYSLITIGLTVGAYGLFTPQIDANSILSKNEDKKIEYMNKKDTEAEEAKKSSSSPSNNSASSASKAKDSNSENSGSVSAEEGSSFTEEEKNKEEYEKLMPKEDYVYFPVRGDTLSKISNKVTGSMDNWPKIQRYNNLDDSELREIEVNQPIVIPEKLARNKQYLFDGVFVEETDKFDGFHVPYNYVQARRGEDLESISKRVYGTYEFSDRLLSYNKELNSLFSSKIYKKEFIFLPPDSYLTK